MCRVIFCQKYWRASKINGRFFAVPANFPDTQVGKVTELKAREQRGWPGSDSKHACASMLSEKQQNYDASYMNAVGEAAELKR